MMITVIERVKQFAGFVLHAGPLARLLVAPKPSSRFGNARASRGGEC
jgi:hypothetical protein